MALPCCDYRSVFTDGSWLDFGRAYDRRDTAAHRLPTQDLFLDHLAGIVMNRAVLLERLDPLIILYLDLLPVESGSQVQCEFEFRCKQRCRRPRLPPATRPTHTRQDFGFFQHPYGSSL